MYAGHSAEHDPGPHGLPFAQAGPSFTDGWRWMYGVGALLALVAIVLRVQLPESPRWLVGQGRLKEADAVVKSMEETAARRGPLPDPPAEVPVDRLGGGGYEAFAHIFRSRTYVMRVLVLVLVWFFGYVTVFAISAGGTSLLTSLHYPPPEAGVILAVGAVGFLVCALVAVQFAERLERKLWLPIGAVVTVIGAILVAEAGTNSLVAFIGMGVIFFGFNIWVPMTYALSAESFPTRARTTGFGLVDGFGHLGGGIGVLLIAPQIPHMSVLGAFLVVAGFLVVAAVIVQFAINARDRRFEELSP